MGTALVLPDRAGAPFPVLPAGACWDCWEMPEQSDCTGAATAGKRLLRGFLGQNSTGHEPLVGEPPWGSRLCMEVAAFPAAGQG